MPRIRHSVTVPPHSRAVRQVMSLLIGQPISTRRLRREFGLSPAQAKRDLATLRRALSLVRGTGDAWIYGPARVRDGRG